MGGLFALVFVAVVVALVVRLVTEYAGNRDAAWQEAADQLRLSFTPRRANPLEFWRPADDQHRSMRGTVDGLPVRARTSWDGSRDNRQTWTEYRVGYPPLGIGLKLYRTGMWGRIAGKLTGRDIEVGDDEFDHAHRIEGRQSEAVAAFLTPARRVAIDRLLSELDGARVVDNGIVWRRKGVVGSSGELVSSIRRLVAAAGAISGHSAASGAMTEALARQRRGDLAESAERLRTAARGSGDVELRRTEAETLYAAGRHAEAAEEFETLERDLPVDEQVRRWRELAQARRDGEALPDLEPVPDRPSGEVSTDPGAVADELFDPKLLSFETARRFEARYEGIQVRWGGILVRATPYRGDLDFRGGPGTKAVVRVHTLANDLYAGRDVEAVVQLPPDDAARLGTQRGKEVRFAGTLVRIDPLMRNLFVANGRLL